MDVLLNKLICQIIIGPDTKISDCKNSNYLFTHQFKHVFGCSKEPLIETVQNICCGCSKEPSH